MHLKTYNRGRQPPAAILITIEWVILIIGLTFVIGLGAFYWTNGFDHYEIQYFTERLIIRLAMTISPYLLYGSLSLLLHNRRSSFSVRIITVFGAFSLTGTSIGLYFPFIPEHLKGWFAPHMIATTNWQLGMTLVFFVVLWMIRWYQVRHADCATHPYRS